MIRAVWQYNCIRVEGCNWAGSKRQGEFVSAAYMIKFVFLKDEYIWEILDFLRGVAEAIDLLWC